MYIYAKEYFYTFYTSHEVCPQKNVLRGKKLLCELLIAKTFLYKFAVAHTSGAFEIWSFISLELLLLRRAVHF